jgi:hypothetical protein
MPYTNPTFAAVQSILKIKYPDGALPQALYKDFPLLSLVKKTTNFDGEFRVVALQNERPQGSSSVFSTAQAVATSGLRGGGGQYNRFQVYRTRHYGILRMDGETMKAAVRTSGALVDLWNNETDGISKNEMADLEFQLFGDGTGVRGIVSTYTSPSPTLATAFRIQLATPADAVYFNLGMRLTFFTSAGSAKVETNANSNGLYVVAIDRKAGTIDVTALIAGTATLPTFATPPAATDVIARAGDYLAAASVAQASNGSANGVITGIQAWIPATVTSTQFWGLDRSSDPVRLAGQRLNSTGLPMNEALMEAEAQVAIQGVGSPDTIVVNPLDLQNLKKALGTDIVYDRVVSNVAGVSFKAIEYDGMNGPMKILSDPFCPRNKAFMLQLPSWELSTLGPAPQMLDYDNNDFLRVASDDQYEVRFGHYGQFLCNNPGANIVLTNFGL